MSIELMIDTIRGSIIFPASLLVIISIALIYSLKMLIKKFKNKNSSNFLFAGTNLINIITTVLLFVFFLNIIFNICNSYYLITLLKKDSENKEICTVYEKEIERIDQNSFRVDYIIIDSEKYVYLPDQIDLELNEGDKYTVRYYNYSKFVIDIN